MGARGDRPDRSSLNMIENKRPDVERKVTDLLGLLIEGSELGHGHRVGSTGPPGWARAASSRCWRASCGGRARPWGLVAVDPRRCSGGALLGDLGANGVQTPTTAPVRALTRHRAPSAGSRIRRRRRRVLACAYDMVLVETSVWARPRSP